MMVTSTCLWLRDPLHGQLERVTATRPSPTNYAQGNRSNFHRGCSMEPRTGRDTTSTARTRQGMTKYDAAVYQMTGYVGSLEVAPG